MVSIHASAFPQIAIIMLGVTYGLQVSNLFFCLVYITLHFGQAIIFILKREFMLVGWMVVYLLSYYTFCSVIVLYLTALLDIRCIVSSSRYIPSGVWMNLVGATLVW
jgi:hypothetical protein